MKKIILASSSPRRRQLLKETGLCFEVDFAGDIENLHPELEPHKLVEKLSLEKAIAVANKHHNAIIIAADTVGVVDGMIIGKPRSEADARKMLNMLSGKSHVVITGFTVMDTMSGKTTTRTVSTKVYFRNLTEKEINDYIATGEPLDKAGAYGIQGLGSALVERIEGDFNNVVGLPLGNLAATLGEFGVNMEKKSEKIKEIEEKIADLKARWPAHSVPPSMWQELEDLEDQLEQAKRGNNSQDS